jgi:TolB-like protein/DNA-binding winged helix-turn-helix (wHTH) protein/Flp pilus assembly protein TadD
MPSPTKAVIRFGVFELDLRSGELSKQGRKIRFQEQPLQILSMLLERPGELVTREELRERLWPADTFVDFDRSLNTAIKRVRDALGDSAENPRFVETVARRGYRFIAPIAQDQSEAAPEPDPPSVIQTVPGRTRRKGAIAAAILVLLGAGTAWGIWSKSHGEELASPVLSVLPFDNLSPDPDSEYFSEGLTDEIIQSLSVIDGLEVTSRTSSLALKDARLDIREIGKKLNATHVLEGSVRKDRDDLRVIAQLIRASDGKHVWSSTYDRKMKDAFAIQEEIAASIANALRLSLGARKRRGTDNAEAHDLYLRGRHALDSGEGRANALQYFEQAIAKDSKYALAHAGAADALLEMHMMLMLPYSEAYRRSKAAAERALQLDPLLSEGHAAMALVHSREEYAREEAEKSFRRAIELNPNNAHAHMLYGYPLLAAGGRFEEALVENRRAVDLDPLSPSTSAALAEVLLLAGRYDDAIDQARKTIALNPRRGSGYVVQGRALYSLGRNDEALEVMHEADVRSPLGSSTGWLACANIKAGRQKEALEILEKNLQGAYRKPPPARNLLRIYACLGDREHAFEYLQKMYDEHQPGLDMFFRYSELAWMQSDPRFAALQKKVGLKP